MTSYLMEKPISWCREKKSLASQGKPPAEKREKSLQWNALLLSEEHLNLFSRLLLLCWGKSPRKSKSTTPSTAETVDSWSNERPDVQFLGKETFPGLCFYFFK